MPLNEASVVIVPLPCGQLENRAVAGRRLPPIGRAVQIAAAVHDQAGQRAFPVGAVERGQGGDRAAALGQLENGAVAAVAWAFESSCRTDCRCCP